MAILYPQSPIALIIIITAIPQSCYAIAPNRNKLLLQATMGDSLSATAWPLQKYQLEPLTTEEIILRLPMDLSLSPFV